MVTRQEFMSIALTKCGTSNEMFAQMSELWSERKETLREMGQQEVAEALECP